MNKFFVFLAALFFISSAQAGTVMQPIQDDLVAARDVEALSKNRAGAVTVKALSVYQGGPEETSALYLTVLDESPSGGDTQHGHTYVIPYLRSAPWNLKLTLEKNGKYTLTMMVKMVVGTAKGDLVVGDRAITIEIALDRNGAIQSVERK